MTRIESGLLTLNPRSVNLDIFVNTIYEMLRPKAEEKKLGFTTEFSPKTPSYIQVDETKLRQILINLLSNAIKFTNQGIVSLRVGVASRADGKTDPSSDVSALAPPNPPAESELIHLLFEITDTGPGIAPDELEVLFDPFVQTEVGRRSQEGTGLGLPISQRFVQFMGGSITVKSTVGVGSVFTVEIPVMLAHSPDDQKIQPKGRAVGLAPGQPNYRILVVEDQTLNRKLLVKLLTAIGFDVQEATQGEEAIAIYQSWQPHLIWMDVRMPVMDGYEVTRRIRQLQTNYETVNSSGYRGGGAAAPQSIIVPKIIALTANAFAEDRSAALAAGYDDFVCKPIQEADLLEKISEHLGVRYLYQDSNPTSNVSSKYISSSSKQAHSTSSLSAPTLTSPNLQRLLQEVAGGDILIFADYIADNIAELVKLMQQLRMAVDAQDAVMLGLVAHSLRATGMTFAANSLVELCLVIEQSANAGIVTVMPEQLLQLEAAVERLITLLQLQQIELRQQ
jgi:CheY-like chemotaxis protein